MKSNFLFISFLVIVIIILISCNKKDLIQLNSKEGVIEGQIAGYDNIIKGGKLSYFDCVSRIVRTEIFAIESSGHFKVRYLIPHPIYESTYIELQGKPYELFLEPGKNLKILLKNGKLQFPDKSGLLNEQIRSIDDTIYAKFKDEINRINRLYLSEISYNEYIREVTDLEKKKLFFIDELEKTANYDPQVYSLLREKTKYTSAKFWINFRYDYATGRPRTRDTLFPNFYEDLFKAYPISARKALPTREYTDYIANISMALSDQDNKESNSKILQQSTQFSEHEKKLIEGIQNRDTTIINSVEWKKFATPENRIKMTEMAMRYYFSNILISCHDLPKGLGRDLIISQGLCRYYFSNTFIQPSDNEWTTIKQLIINKSIYEYLLDLENSLILNSKSDGISELPVALKTEANTLNKDLISKYKGKVIYLDFWATWCGPCRSEIPDSKLMIQQFKNKDFIFIGLCCDSKKQDWQNMVATENLEGIQLFLNDQDYTLFSSLYKVKGFPTYILIDKAGNVIDYEAPRPSSQEILFNKITELLEQ